MHAHTTAVDSRNDADWTVEISLRERDGRTCATARLRAGDHESVGVGLTALRAAERGYAGAGWQIAVADALSDLARQVRAHEKRCDVKSAESPTS
jgi:hypothetical protein